MVMSRWQAAADAWNKMLTDSIQTYENAKTLTEDPTTPTDKFVLVMAQYWVNMVGGLDNVTEAWLGGKYPKPSEVAINVPPTTPLPIVRLSAAPNVAEVIASFATNLVLGPAGLPFTVYKTSDVTKTIVGKANVANGKLDVQIAGLGGLTPVPAGKQELWAGSLALPDMGGGPPTPLAIVMLLRNG